MSFTEVGLSYDASTQPSDVAVRFGLSLHDTTLKATVQAIQPLIVTLTPSGSVPSQILSGVAWPLAQLLGTVMPTMASNLINGYSFDVLSISPSSTTVLGEQITVAPGNLQLTNAGGMLMVQGTIAIS